MSFIAINICLTCNAFDTAAIPLSLALAPAAEDDTPWDDKVSYRLVSLAEKKLQRGFGHAHCTVAQLCVRAADISDVKDAVKLIWMRHREKAVEAKEKFTMKRVKAGPVFGKTSDEMQIRLPFLTIQRSDALLALHNDIIDAIKPFQVKLGSMDVAKSTFHKNFPAEGHATVQWMIDYLDKNSGANYNPHVTLGASPVETIDKLTFFQETKVSWRECRLVVSHMGNYCSCFELLE